MLVWKINGAEWDLIFRACIHFGCTPSQFPRVHTNRCTCNYVTQHMHVMNAHYMYTCHVNFWLNLIYQAKNSLLILCPLSQDLIKVDTENMIVSLREARIDNRTSPTKLLRYIHVKTCKYLPRPSSSLSYSFNLFSCTSIVAYWARIAVHC